MAADFPTPVLGMSDEQRQHALSTVLAHVTLCKLQESNQGIPRALVMCLVYDNGYTIYLHTDETCVVAYRPQAFWQGQFAKGGRIERTLDTLENYYLAALCTQVESCARSSPEPLARRQ